MLCLASCVCVHAASLRERLALRVLLLRATASCPSTLFLSCHPWVWLCSTPLLRALRLVAAQRAMPFSSRCCAFLDAEYSSLSPWLPLPVFHVCVCVMDGDVFCNSSSGIALSPSLPSHPLPFMILFLFFFFPRFSRIQKKQTKNQKSNEPCALSRKITGLWHSHKNSSE